MLPGLHKPIRRRPKPRACLVVEELESRWLPSVNVLTYHNDPASTGQNLNETNLTPANLSVTAFGKQFADAVDGQVYAQPLYKAGLSIAGATHNVVFVATEGDSVFALDANEPGPPLWQVTMLRPGERTLTSADVNAGEISPQIGITGTPVIDAASGTLYVVTKATTAPVGTLADLTNTVQRLHALDISTGAEKFGGPVAIQASVNGTGDGNDGQGHVPFNSQTQLQRPALSLSKGVVYIAWASHGDIDPYHGWVMGYDAATLHQLAVFNDTPNGSRGGIWESGGALATDARGNLYLETGNGSFDGTTPPGAYPADADYGDSFLKLAVDPTSNPNNPNPNGWGLKVADFFTPFNQQDLSNNDVDLGSGGPMLLPDALGSPEHPHLLLGGGKEGRIYLVDRDNMGKFDSTADHVVQETAPGVINGIFDTPALFNKSFYYAGGYGDFAKAFSIAGGAFSGPTSQSTDGNFGFPGATPSISAAGSGNSIVWVLDRGSNELRAYDANDLSKELYTSDRAANGLDQLGNVVKFTVPTVADGQVYVGTENQLVVYGLRVPQIVDNGTPRYSETGTWTTATGQGHYGPDLRYSAPGGGENTATWQVSGLVSGKYDVQMTWSAWPNQATNAPFQVYDGTTLLTTIAINQKVDPLGVTVSGSVFQSLGTFSITSGTVKVVLSNKANGYVIADAMRVDTPPNTTVDLNWTGGSLTGPSTTDTESTFTISRTYNVSGGPVPADFTIGYYASLDTNIADGVLLGRENITSSADKSNGLHAGTSQPFQITNGGNYYLFARLDDTNVITETDKTNNIAQTTQQTAVALVTPYILDNGQFGYSETGTWVTATGQSHYGPDLRYSAPGGGENTATWQVGGLASGKYDVQMTWSAWPNQASNAPFKIYDGSALLATVTVNQKADPAGTQVGTSVFQSLGNFTIASGTLKVVLSNNANGYVIADAMRVATPAATTLDLNWIGGGITGPAATDTQSPFTISRTYNVSGGPVPADFTIGYYASLDTIISDGILLGRETITASADKSNGTHAGTSPAFQLSNGGKYYLFARLDDTNVISETDKTNNVAQTAQQTFVAAVTPYILDNGQYGYSETGTWVTATGQGHYGPDLRYSPAGGGENTATWQVGGLASGTYNVQVTWSAWPNQATNAPYQIYDGTTILATVLINQKVDPVGTTIGNSVFQTLGTFTITGGTLKVILSNNANGYVIADALRVV